MEIKRGGWLRVGCDRLRGHRLRGAINMALNPQYLEIGQQFAKQYYTLFDDPASRAQLVNLYSVSTCINRVKCRFLAGAATVP